MILKINNRKFDYFNAVSVSMSYDKIASTFNFVAHFDPDNPSHRSLFQPLKYSKVEILHEGETLLIGRKVTTSFTSNSTPQLAQIGGYSLTGVFEDSNIPLSVYPIQSDGLTLRQIAEKILKPFDIAVVVDSIVADDVDSVLESSDASTTGTVKSYLTSLATQKNVILSHTKNGALLFTRAKANQAPIADLSDAVDKKLSVSGQGIHSSIAVFKDANIVGGNAGENELDNPLVTSFRPSVSVQSSGDDNDTELTAKLRRAAELKSIKLTIKLDSWMINGKVIRPNRIISVKDKSLHLYKRTNWFIEAVTLSGNEKEQTATLKCVLPEVYTNQTPSNPFS